MSERSRQQFRQRVRQWGVWLPIDDVSAHLACGWRLAGDAEDPFTRDGRQLLAPPPCFLEEAA